MSETTAGGGATTMEARRTPRRPGRPATYVFDKPDAELSERERKLKSAIEKRRLRQNRSYHRRKSARAAAAAAAAAATSSSSSNHPATTLPHGIHPQLGAFSQRTAFPLAFPHPTQFSLPSVPSAVAPVLNIPASVPSASGSVHIPNAAIAHVPAPHLTALNIFEHSTNISKPEPSRAADDDACVPELDASALAANSQSQSDATALVAGALEAAQVAVTSSLASSDVEIPNLRTALEQQRELLRVTGIKSMIFDNFRNKYMALSPTAQSALRHLVVFPRSFELHAAASVTAQDLVSMQNLLDTMVSSNFLVSMKGRFELHEAARSFLCEDTSVLAFAGDPYAVAQKRFLQHFRLQLEKLQDEKIHRVGWLRERAMTLYDAEKQNMRFAEFLSQGNSKIMLRDFLCAGITVMRYCVKGADREEILLKALEEDEVSSESVYLNFPALDISVAGPGMGESSVRIDGVPDDVRARDAANKARLQLALAEAYFDQLKIDKAEVALVHALALMKQASTGAGSSSSSVSSSQSNSSSSTGVVDSVLVLLLLSNVRMAGNRVREARQLCVKALKILYAAGLARSTFGINAMANLVSIYLEEEHLDKAQAVATRLVDTLNNMSYTGMPIFADALGVCGMVSMAQGNYKEAERQFGTGVEIVNKWGARTEWEGPPVQHCLDLDLWLMESLSCAILKQGRAEEAQSILQRVADMKTNRGLSNTPPQTPFMQQMSTGTMSQADEEASLLDDALGTSGLGMNIGRQALEELQTSGMCVARRHLY